MLKSESYDLLILINRSKTNIALNCWIPVQKHYMEYWLAHIKICQVQIDYNSGSLRKLINLLQTLIYYSVEQGQIYNNSQIDPLISKRLSVENKAKLSQLETQKYLFRSNV